MIVTLPMLVSFYTPDYADLAALLRSDCERLGLEHRISSIPDQGSWLENCAHKPAFLCSTLWPENQAPLDRPVVWVDADARVRSLPTLFGELTDCDVAFHRLPPNRRYPRGELLSGTIYLAPTFATRDLLWAWADTCDTNPCAWDQVSLERVLDQMGARVRVRELPVSYCRIFDHPDHEPAVIEHFQASRMRSVR